MIRYISMLLPAICLQGMIINSPVNIATDCHEFFGCRSAGLTCSVQRGTGVSVQWFQYRSLSDNSPIMISNGTRIVHTPFRGAYIAYHRRGETVYYDLIFLFPSLSEHPARYGCLNTATKQQKYAYFILLGEPVITPNTTITEINVGDYVQYTCFATAHLRGDIEERTQWTPNITWTGPRALSVLNETVYGGTSMRTWMTSSIAFQVTPEMNGTSLTCISSLDKPPPRAGFADNAPTRSVTRNSERLLITYSVINVRVKPERLEQREGQIFTCVADGNPKPKYKWIILGRSTTIGNISFSNTTIEGQLLHVPDFEIGGNNEYRILCQATNAIRSVIYTKESQIIHLNIPWPIGIVIGCSICSIILLVIMLCFLPKIIRKIQTEDGCRCQRNYKSSVSPIEQDHMDPNRSSISSAAVDAKSKDGRTDNQAGTSGMAADITGNNVQIGSNCCIIEEDEDTSLCESLGKG